MARSNPLEHLAHSITDRLARIDLRDPSEPSKSDNDDDYRHRWILYEFATLYWRYKNNWKQAMECVFSAYTYVPHQYRLFPLFQFVQIFVHYNEWVKFEGYQRSAPMANEIHLMALRFYNRIEEDSKTWPFRSHPNEFQNMHNFAMGMLNIHMEKQSIGLQHLAKIDIVGPKKYPGTLDLAPEINEKVNSVNCVLTLLQKLDKHKHSLESTLTMLRDYKTHHQEYVKKVEQLKSNCLSIEKQMRSHVDYYTSYQAAGYEKILKKSLSSEIHIGPNYNRNRNTELDFEFDVRSNRTEEELKAAQKSQNIKTPCKNRKIGNRCVKEVEPMCEKCQKPDQDGVIELNNHLDTKPKVQKTIYDWRMDGWPQSKQCQDLFGAYPKIHEFPAGFVDIEARGYKIPSIFADSKKYAKEKFGSKPSENKAPIHDPKPFCDSIVEIDGFEQDEKVIEYMQLNSLKESMLLPDFDKFIRQFLVLFSYFE